MISPQHFDDLIIDYQIALADVNSAARTLKETSVFAHALPPEFARISAKLIDDADNLYQAINSAMGFLDNAGQQVRYAR
ncbi:MAG TPA: hypothetical protein VHX38_15220 [Pseudonocardiaceae bacterium]|jgi:hypothetical protein|nr:hypothetical protein [Pseudonocardiaceae bacterium]